MQKSIDKIYYAAIYLRLSKEDGDLSSGEKKESNSIANQRKLIEDYLSRNPEITLVQEFCDDGYTGANFDRPDFQRMMEQVKTGKINCIIVKDLSRFGRDYIDSGRYIEKIFPSLGIRFIAINDNYDSAQSQQAGNEIILPFKNLINDSYSRDISIKIRSNLETKRRFNFITSMVNVSSGMICIRKTPASRYISHTFNNLSFISLSLLTNHTNITMTIISTKVNKTSLVRSNRKTSARMNHTVLFSSFCNSTLIKE